MPPTHMNDRWLFIASLVLFGIFAAFVMRYFVRQLERFFEDYKQARHTFRVSLRGMVAEQSAASLESWRLPWAPLYYG